MANLISPRPRTVGGPKRHFSIVASQFNATFVQGLIDHVTAEFRTLLPTATTSLVQVPGPFQLPLVVREHAIQKRTDPRIAMRVTSKRVTSHHANCSQPLTDDI